MGNFDFERIYSLYPRRIGKKLGIEKCKKLIKTKEQYEELERAVINYGRYCSDEQMEARFIKHFSSFMTTYEDWIDESAGSLNLQTKDDKWKKQTLSILRGK